MAHLGPHRYGKAGIRLVTVRRDDDRHHLSDLTVDVWLEGDTGSAYADADNATVLPTDTMRGTVYAFARQQAPVPMEDFALRLADHFRADIEPVHAAEVHIASSAWRRIHNHGHAFTRDADVRRTVMVRVDGTGTHIEGGIDNLVVLKSAGSSFEDFLVDGYTTLSETDDRILATNVTARWGMAGRATDWDALTARAHDTLLAVFADHESASVQHTLYDMGVAALDACAELRWIRLSMPNLHHHLVDLSPYGLDNPNEVFVATDRPYGMIQATVVRDGR